MGLASPSPRPRGNTFVWGFASQAASSATNFGLTLLAGITLGAGGLGSVFVGFATYLLIVGLQRALVTDPLVAGSSALDAQARVASGRMALTSVIGWAVAASGALAVASELVSGPIGRGLLLFVPWIIPSLVQDFWRAILFRDQRGRAAAMNDALWLAVMLLSLPLVLTLRTGWSVVGCWGLGATAGTAAGFFQTHVGPAPPGRAFAWWRSKAWPLGRWLAGDFMIYNLGSQSLVFVFAVILGTQALGGLRAAESVFAPLSLIGPALALPGLPYLSRKVAHDPHRAKAAAARLGATGGAIASAYLVLMAWTGGRILSWLFGDPFQSFSNLFWPFGIGQIVTISTIGFALLLTAEGRGRALLAARVIGSVAAVGLGISLALRYGVTGAAWGMMLGGAITGISTMLFAVSRSSAGESDVARLPTNPATSRT